MEGNIKRLESEFTKKGFKYTKLLVSYWIFAYEVVSEEGWVHYDIFKAKILKHNFSKEYEYREAYPHDEAFGLYAWNYRSLRKALEKFFSLYSEAEDNHLRQMAEAGIYSGTRLENGFYDED